MSDLRGIIHGKSIELEQESGLPEGQRVAVDLRPLEEPTPSWLDRFRFDPVRARGRFLIKGTNLLVDDLVGQLDEGRTDEEIFRVHPELSRQDIDAVREYARAPEALRRSFGGWAEESEQLEQYLDWCRQQRKAERRGVED
jgi:uncharacterized protein (DUF433 family)